MNMIAFAVDTASVEDAFIMGGGLSLEMIASAVSTARVEDVFNVRDGAWWAKAGGTATILEKGGRHRNMHSHKRTACRRRKPQPPPHEAVLPIDVPPIPALAPAEPALRLEQGAPI